MVFEISKDMKEGGEVWLAVEITGGDNSADVGIVNHQEELGFLPVHGEEFHDWSGRSHEHVPSQGLFSEKAAIGVPDSDTSDVFPFLKGDLVKLPENRIIC